MDLIVNEILLDCLNLAKVVFKNGLTGTLILGDKYQKVFTALPEYFTLSDHDVRIVTSSDAVKDLEQVRQVIPEFVKAGGLPPDIIIEAITSKSIPDLKYKVKKAMKVQKEENNKIAQLTKKLEEMSNQMKQADELIKKQQTEIKQLNKTKLQLEQQEMQMKYQIEQYKAKTDRTYKEATIEEQKRRTELEIEQMYDGNPYNDTVSKIR